jgi:hypothetical protein
MSVTEQATLATIQQRRASGHATFAHILRDRHDPSGVLGRDESDSRHGEPFGPVVPARIRTGQNRVARRGRVKLSAGCQSLSPAFRRAQLIRFRPLTESESDNHPEHPTYRGDDNHGGQTAQVGIRPEPVTRGVGGGKVEGDKAQTEADRDADDPAHST